MAMSFFQLGRIDRFLFLSLFLFAPHIQAHPLDLGLMQFDLSSKELSLDLNTSLVDQLLNLKDGNNERFQSNKEALAALILTGSSLEVSGAKCQWTASRVEVLATSVRLLTGFGCSAPLQGELKFKIPFVHQKALPSTFQLLVKIIHGVDEELHTLREGADEVTVNLKAIESHFGDFVWMGVRHIGAAPSEWKGASGLHFPDGIDHILFLCALLLVGGSFWELLKTATGFTVGHSVTLALASLNIVRLPARLTESAIALSIAYVAIETLVVKQPKHRWKLAAAFGLVHGFGFASALGELALGGGTLVKALVGFNLGVEVGQIIIMAFIFPGLLFLERFPSQKRYFTLSGSLAIALIALYWFLQRAFLIF